MSAWRVEGAVRVSRSFTLPNSRPEPGGARAVEAERESGEGGWHVETISGRGHGRDADGAGRAGHGGRMGSILPRTAHGGGGSRAKRALAPAAAGGGHRGGPLLQPPPAPRAGLSAQGYRLSGAGLSRAAPAAPAGLPRRAGGACRLVRGAVSFVRCPDGYVSALSRGKTGVPVAVWVRGGPRHPGTVFWPPIAPHATRRRPPICRSSTSRRATRSAPACCRRAPRPVRPHAGGKGDGERVADRVER